MGHFVVQARALPWGSIWGDSETPTACGVVEAVRSNEVLAVIYEKELRPIDAIGPEIILNPMPYALCFVLVPSG